MVIGPNPDSPTECAVYSSSCSSYLSVFMLHLPHSALRNQGPSCAGFQKIFKSFTLLPFCVTRSTAPNYLSLMPTHQDCCPLSPRLLSDRGFVSFKASYASTTSQILCPGIFRSRVELEAKGEPETCSQALFRTTI